MIEQSGEPHWVIEHTSEFIRRWWTGNKWSEDYRKAKWYERNPEAARQTMEEEADAVYYETREMKSG